MERTEFENYLKKVMQHNGYEENMITVSECDKKNKWTPTDLILREYYNNNCMSAKGFLGITPNECEKCFNYIRDNQKQLKADNYYNKCGCNNFGFTLWENYQIC